MLTTSARLLRLLSLLQTHRDWTGGALADQLQVTERTVRRDVDRLRALGYPVDSRPGTAGGYRLGAGAALPPLLLDEDEAVAVAVGLRSAALSGVTGLHETALRALATLEQTLPSRLRHRVRTLQSAIAPMTSEGPVADIDVLIAVAGAIRDSERLRADYRDHGGRQSHRLLEPHRILHSGRRWYLLAWDVDRDDWRTLRLDRLTPRTPTGPRFLPRDAPEPDLSRFLAEGITTRAYRHRCRVTIMASAELVADRIPPTAGVVTTIDATSCELLVGSSSLDEAAVWLGLTGAELHVHEPPELRDHLRALAERLLRAADPQDPVPGAHEPPVP
jgi:predicted DNA-binding transcriptional regulator YafY